MVVILAVLIATSGGSRAVPGVGARNEAAAVSGLLAGIAQRGTVLGSPTAPVTMQYFGDLECSACRDFTLGALPGIIHRWVGSGRLKIEYRSLETATREPETFRRQLLAAGKQDKAWDFIELFYREQGEDGSGYVTESYLQGLARQIPGLLLANWINERGDRTFASRLTADAQAADGSRLTSTPGFLVGRTGGTLKKYEYTSLTDPSGFDAAIEAAIGANGAGNRRRHTPPSQQQLRTAVSGHAPGRLCGPPGEAAPRVEAAGSLGRPPRVHGCVQGSDT